MVKYFSQMIWLDNGWSMPSYKISFVWQVSMKR
jgi:hypothetical protein